MATTPVTYIDGMPIALTDTGNTAVNTGGPAYAIATTAQATIGTLNVSADAQANAASPTWVEGSLNPLSSDLSGNLRTAVYANGAVVSSGNALPILDGYLAPTNVVWTSATSLNTTISTGTSGYDTVIVTVVANANVTGGAVTFEVYDGATWIPIKVANISNYTTTSTATLSASFTNGYQVPLAGFPQFRVRLSSIITGASSSVTVTLIVSSAPDVSVVTVGLDPAQPLPVGTNTIGSILGKSKQVAVTPTISTSAYTAGYIVGGLLTFTNVFGSVNSGILQDITVKSKSVQTTGYKLYLFGTQPTNSTWTDHTAPAINAADISYLLGWWALGASDSGLGTVTINSADALAADLVATTANLYGILVCTGTPTYASTSDITVTIRVLQD